MKLTLKVGSMRSFHHPFALLLSALCLLGSLSGARAAPLPLMTWNIEGGESVPSALAARIEQALDSIGPVEVLVLQEIVSEAQVEAAAKAGGFDYWAISDFSPPVEVTNAWHKSLEVAVLSRRPIKSVAEWDTTGRKRNGDGHPPRTSARRVPTQELQVAIKDGDDPPPRGFLRVDLADGWTVYAVHWKSSRGKHCNAEDRASARQRERQAAGLAADAASALAAGRTIIVAGDYNIQAPGRVLRVGTNPNADCAPTQGRCEGLCGPGALDGYDDSIAILLAMDPSARLLSGELDATYLLRRFPGGAIDHILVAGPKADRLATATTPPVSGKHWQGSDHRPVITDEVETSP
ncbi:endonuclease/exonuclease/phosphatase family protein [Lamprobacter modestohalophilus]|uniref:endonuclease/exonuclease/phosphatase family protein n=1 Tax=Lamprobacter modestohalophilus TaxID=1064514 RepID=UPI002ADEEC4C|nr:endonuclease/exonuclease/phosphatase family protein [Lamprobacter modestohalophilus]MEA1051532.1 endonuclease/exonuclease/phosphatase family protein [Lamprobacter modestohalophilus]